MACVEARAACVYFALTLQPASLRVVCSRQRRREVASGSGGGTLFVASFLGAKTLPIRERK